MPLLSEEEKGRRENFWLSLAVVVAVLSVIFIVLEAKKYNEEMTTRAIEVCSQEGYSGFDGHDEKRWIWENQAKIAKIMKDRKLKDKCGLSEKGVPPPPAGGVTFD